MSQASDRRAIIQRVLHEPTDRGVPTSYQVLFTGERVMLLFGATHASHPDVLLKLIDEQAGL